MLLGKWSDFAIVYPCFLAHTSRNEGQCMKVQATTGVPEIDRLAGGIIPGDNIVWEVDSGVPVERFVVSFFCRLRTRKIGGHLRQLQFLPADDNK